MSGYTAPLDDMRFALWQVLEFDTHYANLPGAEDATPDTVDAILEEGAKFGRDVLSPLNSVGDVEGCSLNEGVVTTPTGFKEAYRQYVDGGWPSMTQAPELGGQGLPQSLSTIFSEMTATANWSWWMYPGLSHGAMSTIETHGTDEQKSQYLKPLVNGEWTGTMCLTESHCGTDLGLLKTRAELNDDGSYAITGQKIFISSGEHDMTENIVHIVLARLPGAPDGTRGISLFIVPKFLPADEGVQGRSGEGTSRSVGVQDGGDEGVSRSVGVQDGGGESGSRSVGVRNGVMCGSIEHKMGIHGNATCVLNFDAARGFLIGPPNRGLNCMFTFMNVARIGTAVQGLGHAELAFQNSLKYARDRLQMRSLTGAEHPDKAADPIIVHPDVRRMLLTQKAFSEGGRLFIYYCASLVDTASQGSDDAARAQAENELAFLTPIAKAFLTETGHESANLGMQVFGGHGYIREWGMEQNVRDARIAMIYEGTTGVQAIDLLGRKVLGSQGALLRTFTRRIDELCDEHADNPRMSRFVIPMKAISQEWTELTQRIGMASLQDPQEAGAASVDYLMYSGYAVLGYFWTKSAAAAHRQLEAGEGDATFLRAKLFTARFYMERILPRTRMHSVTMMSGADNLMDLDESHFAF